MSYQQMTYGELDAQSERLGYDSIEERVHNLCNVSDEYAEQIIRDFLNSRYYSLDLYIANKV